MDVAERILTLAYALRSEIESARSPFNPAAELREAEEKLAAEQSLNWDRLSDAEQNRLKLAQCTLTRLGNASEQWQKLWEVKPMALAYFGKAAEEHLLVFWKQYSRIRVSAQMYAQDPGKDEAYNRKLRKDLWGTGDEGDQISENIDQAVQALELELLPILRQIDPPSGASPERKG